MWWFLGLGFLIGVAGSFIFVYWRFTKLYSGKLKVYSTEDGPYTYMEVPSESSFNNGYVILKVETYKISDVYYDNQKSTFVTKTSQK